MPQPPPSHAPIPHPPLHSRRQPSILHLLLKGRLNRGLQLARLCLRWFGQPGPSHPREGSCKSPDGDLEWTPALGVLLARTRAAGARIFTSTAAVPGCASGSSNAATMSSDGKIFVGSLELTLVRSYVAAREECGPSRVDGWAGSHSAGELSIPLASTTWADKGAGANPGG